MPIALGDPPTIAVSIDAGAGFTAYRATYWSAAEWQGDEIKLASDSFDAPVTSSTLAGPPNGDWMLALHLTFANGGTAIDYWRVTVP